MVIIAKTWFPGRCAAMEVIIGEMDWKGDFSFKSKSSAFLEFYHVQILILKTVSV